MTELEYINATNLAKLRIAVYALSSTILPHGGAQRAYRESASQALHNWIDYLERVVETRS